MGTWGVGSFDNDDALDWADDFANAPSLDLIGEALSAVSEMDEDEYLEVTESGAAIAAAEVVAALNGKPSADLPDDIAAWVKPQGTLASPELVSLALSALKRIDRMSEFDDNWIEDSTRQEWHKALSELSSRLAS